MNKNFLIKVITEEENKKYPTIISSCISDTIDEYLKLYITAKENKIPLTFSNLFEEVPDKFLNTEGFIEEIYINPGTDHTYTTLYIYVNVI